MIINLLKPKSAREIKKNLSKKKVLYYNKDLDICEYRNKKYSNYDAIMCLLDDVDLMIYKQNEKLIGFVNAKFMLHACKLLLAFGSDKKPYSFLSYYYILSPSLINK